MLDLGLTESDDCPCDLEGWQEVWRTSCDEDRLEYEVLVLGGLTSWLLSARS